MATLEKIRSRSVLLLIIIGVALIAFIIGDFFTSGRTFFGTGTTVAKVGSEKIDVQDFQRRVEQANQQMQQSGRHDIDQAVIQQQVLNSMIGERLFVKELADLGLKVSDAELTDAMVGSGSANLDAMLRQQGIESARALHDMAFNPATYGLDQQTAAQFQLFWKQLEQQTEQQILQRKFSTLFAGTLTANELDAKALYDENNATSNVAYVMKDFASLSDDDFAVTPEEIKEQWNKEKQSYALDEPQRAINYISVEIAPSAADLVAAEQAVETAVADLNAKEGTEGVADKPEFVVNRNKVTSARIADNRIKNFVDTASAGEAALVSRIGNEFTIAKLISRGAETDSMTVDVFGFSGSRAKADSLIAELNAGRLSFDSLINVDGAQGMQKDLKISLLDASLAPIRGALENAPAGRFFLPDTTSLQGFTVTRINSRKAPVTVYDIATVTYTAEASRATVNKLEADLQAYVKANTTAKAFVDSAAAAGYQAFPAVVSASSAQIGNIPGSRAAVRWAMEAKKGQVSGIIGEETDGRFMAVALNDIYTDYVPATDSGVKAYLTSQVRNDKKAAKLIEEYTGKATDLAGFARLMDTKVDTAAVNFGQLSIYNPGVGGPELAAQITVAEPGKLSAPLKGATGVVVFDVINVDTEGRPYNFDENVITFNRTRGAGAMLNNLELLLLGNKKIENNMLKFFRD